MRDIGSDYAHIEADGCRLPVTKLKVRLVGSLSFGERVKIRTWVEENRSRQLTFAYEVIHPDTGAILVSGFTKRVWTDKHGNVIRAPKYWSSLLEKLPN
jgi:acyl-CoA thioester hydrolase